MKNLVAALAVALAGVLGIGAVALADHFFDESENLVALGHAPEPATYSSARFHTDLAFWGDVAVQGRWDGFRTIDISDPTNPEVLSRVDCIGGQGDVAVYEGVLIRTVDLALDGTGCSAGRTSAPGFEGLQIFDFSDPADITEADLIGTVALDCGSHTVTLVPDEANDRVILYVSSSFPGFFGTTSYGTECRRDHDRFTVVEIPLANPAAARVLDPVLLRNVPVAGDSSGASRTTNQCHDIAAFPDIDRAICAGVPYAVMLDISDPANPEPLFSFTAPGVTGWHSASFTWDGEVGVLGWEPGGGLEARCQQSSPEVERTLFFFDVGDGAELGRWVLPRPQRSNENCTIHNYNVVPTPDRYLLVHGSYQSGTGVVDFTDLANPREVAYSDPPPIGGSADGGEWSSYWYNGVIYESNTTEGLNLYALDDPVAAGAVTLPHLNPQTQVSRIQRIPAHCDPSPDPPSGATVIDGSPSAFTAISPRRVLDTRESGDAGYLCPGQALSLRLDDEFAGVDVSAVAVNITVTDTGGAGFVTAWPGGELPQTSTLNLTAAGQTRANMAIVPVGPNGTFSIYAQTGAHVIVDLAGYFAPPSDPDSGAGRLRTVDAARVLDTRLDGPVVQGSVEVPIAGRGGVPSSGAAAVVVNLTATEAAGPGFVTAYAAGSDRPPSSNLNMPWSGSTVPNLAIVPVDDDGEIELFSSAGAHLIVDVLGWVTDDSVEPSPSGLFVSTAPRRLFDTRPDDIDALQAGDERDLGIDADSGVTLLVNLTGTEPQRPGYVTIWPGGLPQPDVSTLNLDGPLDTRANLTLVGPFQGSEVSVYSSGGTHVLADTMGFFTSD